jgi:hypothetical protein
LLIDSRGLSICQLLSASGSRGQKQAEVMIRKVLPGKSSGLDRGQRLVIDVFARIQGMGRGARLAKKKITRYKTKHRQG